jgi:hypothetical protein
VVSEREFEMANLNGDKKEVWKGYEFFGSF